MHRAHPDLTATAYLRDLALAAESTTLFWLRGVTPASMALPAPQEDEVSHLWLGEHQSQQQQQDPGSSGDTYWKLVKLVAGDASGGENADEQRYMRVGWGWTLSIRFGGRGSTCTSRLALLPSRRRGRGLPTAIVAVRLRKYGFGMTPPRA